MILLLGYGISNQSVEKILINKKLEYKIYDGFRDFINESNLDNVDPHDILGLVKDYKK